MNPKKIIPCLDMAGGRVVKGTNFVELRDAGDPVEFAQLYCKEGADELVFLDIMASLEDRDILLNIVKKTAEKVSVPFTVGGGIRDLDTISALLAAGADKISLNTAAVKNPELLRQAAEKFGTKRIVLAVDVRQTAPEKWEVVTRGGQTLTGMDVIDWLKKGQELGAGEILLTSMDRDGTKDGYDCALLKAAAEAVGLPIVASGGAGKLEHISDALQYCDAALLASLLHFKEVTIAEVKDYLRSKNIPVY